MTHASGAVLVTGLFGTGKSSVAVEIADLLDAAGKPYAVVDLDFLAWFAIPDRHEPGIEHRLLLENLAAVVSNYRAIGVRWFVLARALRDRGELDSLRACLGMPVRVVRLTVGLEEIERRLRSSSTRARQDDLREAREWLQAGHGDGLEDLVVVNDRPLREVAGEILDWLGWLEAADPLS